MEVHESMGRRERKKLELERRIRRAASALFHRKGYEETTVDEIAEAADVAKTTLFNYFPRKDALLTAVWEDTYEEVLAELGPAETWEGTGPQQLRRLFQSFAAAMAENPGLSQTMLIEAMRSYWTRHDRSELEQHFLELVEELVRSAQARGELSAEVEPRIGAALLREVYGATVVEWLKSRPAAMTLESELDAKFDVVFRGLGADEAVTEGGAK